jgi:hypothetical protein
MAKFKILISEQDLTQLIVKSMMGSGENNILQDIFKSLTQITGSTPSSFQTNLSVPRGEFPELNLNNPAEYEAYKQIADKFISLRSSNLLGIRGSMLADAAKNSQNQHKRYVPVELALAQLAAEGGFSKNPKSRPIRTKNPFNVGNTDSGKNVYHPSVQSGIQRYYDLIAKNYLVGDKTASDLLRNFVNKNGNRYATGSYEGLVSKIANQVSSMSQPVYASLSKKLGGDIA